jgi:hypothetical protein
MTPVFRPTPSTRHRKIGCRGRLSSSQQEGRTRRSGKPDGGGCNDEAGKSEAEESEAGESEAGESPPEAECTRPGAPRSNFFA